ncbi:MAG: hypothetical protein Q4P24_14275 [Rhodobacterales bacterium]|nr:hypothetical protein [Rhodobacterales bacterium]
MINRREHSTMRPGVFLSRLFLVLALALFGGLHVETGPGDWTTSPLAANDTGPNAAILTAQSPLVRGQLPQDDTPDFILPTLVDLRPTHSAMSAVFFEQEASPSPFAIDIFPPVRGPPAL